MNMNINKPTIAKLVQSWLWLNRKLRTEFAQHIVFMFAILAILAQITVMSFGIYLPTWSLIVLGIMLALIWEIGGKIVQHKHISFEDIVASLIGLALYIILFRL